MAAPVSDRVAPAEARPRGAGRGRGPPWQGGGAGRRKGGPVLPGGWRWEHRACPACLQALMGVRPDAPR